MSECPCGSTIDYPTCCGMYLVGKAIPKTPEAPMQSRYTAYSTANIDYIKKTMQGKPLVGFNEAEAKRWATSVQWMGLSVIETYREGVDEDTGFVEFIARYLDRGTIKTIHEISQFQYINGCWFYIDGEQTAKPSDTQISRNALCPCGSKKKFKNCHAQN